MITTVNVCSNDIYCSAHTSNRMVIVSQHFKLLFRLIQCFGFAPINIASNHFFDKAVNLIPTTLMTIAALSTSYFLFTNPHFASFGLIDIIINRATLVTKLLIVLTANISSFSKRSIYRNLNYEIYQIEQKMYADVQTESRFIRAFTVKILLIYFLFLTSQGLVFYEVVLPSSTFMLSALLNFLFRFTFPTAVLHVVMYCDTIANFLHRLNLEISITSALFIKSNGGKFEFLRSLKGMHINIWKVLAQINQYFGWSLTFIVMESFVYITYQLYSIFLAFEGEFDELGLLGTFPFSILLKVHVFVYTLSIC